MSISNSDLVELYQMYREQLLRRLTAKLRNADDAEEVLQDTFMQYQKSSAQTAIESPQAFLIKISSNLAVDLIRKRTSQRRREENWSNFNVQNSDEQEYGSDTALQNRQITARSEIEQIIALLDELSPQARKVFVLHKFKEMSHKEVAKELGIARSTVEKHMIKALRYLAINLERTKGHHHV